MSFSITGMAPRSGCGHRQWNGQHGSLLIVQRSKEVQLYVLFKWMSMCMSVSFLLSSQALIDIYMYLYEWTFKKSSRYCCYSSIFANYNTSSNFTENSNC
jgi:hypothetical protein